MPDDDDERPGVGESMGIAVGGAMLAIAAFLVRGRTPVPPAVFDAAALLTLGWAVSPLVHHRAGASAATVARGLGLAAAVALLFPALGEGLPAATVPLSLVVLGATLLQADARRKRPLVAISLVGIGLLLVGLFVGIATAGSFPESARLRATLFAAGALVVAGLLARVFLLRAGHAFLAPMPVGIVAGSILVSVYVAFRPLAAGRVANLPLYEWALAAGFAFLAFARLRRAARAHETAESWSLDARRHAQDVRPAYDARMTPIAAVVQRWLERGEGLAEYVQAVERSTGAPVPPPLVRALHDASARPRAIGRARREAAQRRLAAHEAVMRRLDFAARADPSFPPPAG